MKKEIKLICYNRHEESDEILILGVTDDEKDDIIKKYKKEISEYSKSFSRINFRLYIDNELIYTR
jgi:hypothetical protein